MNYSYHLVYVWKKRDTGSCSGNIVLSVFEISVSCDTELINFIIQMYCCALSDSNSLVWRVYT